MRKKGNSYNQPTAEKARKRMISRLDGTEDTQKAIADSMRSVADEEYKAIAEGRDPETTIDEMFQRAYKDVYGGSTVQEKPKKPQQQTADEARAAMIDRMTGKNPDRMPGSK